MPRRTRPSPRPGHSRARKLEHDRRIVLSRWRLLKDLYGHSRSETELRASDLERWHARHESLASLQDPDGRWRPVTFVHPEHARRAGLDLWPANLHLSRNPLTRCSCGLCKWPKDEPGRRARDKRQWRADALEQAETV